MIIVVLYKHKEISNGRNFYTTIMGTLTEADNDGSETIITWTSAEDGSSTGKALSAKNTQRGGVAQFWNTDGAKTAEIKMYISLKEDPSTANLNDWTEYDSLSLSASDSGLIFWSKPYVHILFTADYSASQTGKLDGIVEGVM